MLVSVLPYSELRAQKPWVQKHCRGTKTPQPPGTSVNSTVNHLKPRRESWGNEDIQKHPCISENLENCIHAQDRIYAQKRPLKIIASPLAHI